MDWVSQIHKKIRPENRSRAVESPRVKKPRGRRGCLNSTTSLEQLHSERKIVIQSEENKKWEIVFFFSKIILTRTINEMSQQILNKIFFFTFYYNLIHWNDQNSKLEHNLEVKKKDFFR